MSCRLFVLVALVVAGCSRGVEQPEVPGQYEFSLENMKQQIIVSADGKYSNSFYRDGVLVWSDQGTWIYDKAGGENGISFEGFRFGMPEYSSSQLARNLALNLGFVVPERGVWFVVPEKTLFGVKKICFDPDDRYRCFRSD